MIDEILDWLTGSAIEGRRYRIFVRPLLATAVLLGGLALAWAILGTKLVPVLGWLFILLSPLAFWVLYLTVRVYQRHPQEGMTAFQAENAVIVAIEVALIALVGVNILFVHIAGLGTIPIATAILLLLIRPGLFVLSYYRGKW